MPFFENYFGCFYQRFLSSALFIFETSGTFGLLQNKLADGSLPKREQKQFYLDLRELVHQEKKNFTQ